MSLYPHAVQRPWVPYVPERFITPHTVIIHTNAVDSEDPGPQGTLSWHFQVGQHGTVYQHRDTNTRAAANADANSFAISIETWDGGDPEGNPWNAEQLDALVALVGWCCDTHGIPRSLVDRWDGPGIGYHRLFSQWNQPVHSCPGDTRASQFRDVLLPRITAPPPPPPPTPIPEDVPVVFLLVSRGAQYLVDTVSGFFAPNSGQSNPPVPVIDMGQDPNNFKAACEVMCTNVRTRSS